MKSNFDLKGYVNRIKSDGGWLSLIEYREGHELKRLECFRKYINPEDSVCVIGNMCEIYRRLGVHTKSHFPFQSQPISISSALCEKFKEEIRMKVDRWIITGEGTIPKVLQEDLISSYALRESIAGFGLWEAK